MKIDPKIRPNIPRPKDAMPVYEHWCFAPYPPKEARRCVRPVGHEGDHWTPAYGRCLSWEATNDQV